MTTLSTVRAAVRQDLHDEDSMNYRWTEAVLDRHIGKAVNEYSLATPLEQMTTLATTSGSRDLSLAALSGLVKVQAVEWRLGQFPASLQRFSIWQSTLTLLGPVVPDGSNCRVYWGKLHTLDDGSSTIPTVHEDLICVGAAAFAALDQAIYTTNRLNLGADAEMDYQRLGQLWLRDFRRRLKDLRSKPVTARLYTPANLLVSKSTDYGP